MEQIVINTNLRPSLLQSIIFILIGLGLMVWSDVVLSAIVEVVGAIVILLSIISLILYYKAKKNFPEIKRMPPIDSYASIIFGILLISFPPFFISIFMVLIGVAALIGGLVQFYTLYKIKKAGLRIFSLSYVMPLIMLVLGVLIIINPFHFANAILIILFGSTSLIYGIANLVKYFGCNKEL